MKLQKNEIKHLKEHFFCTCTSITRLITFSYKDELILFIIIVQLKMLTRHITL